VTISANPVKARTDRGRGERGLLDQNVATIRDLRNPFVLDDDLRLVLTARNRR